MGIVHAKAHPKDNPWRRRLLIDDLEKEESASSPDSQDLRDINIETVKARVDKVHVDGIGRTKNDILSSCFSDLFKATNFHDVVAKAHKAKIHLEEIGCFKNIAVFIDTSKGSDATPDGYEVTYYVNEFNRITGGVSTQVGNNEGALLISLRAPNLLGRGERLQMEYSHGSRKSNTFNVAFVKPFRGLYQSSFTASIFKSHSEFPSSGYKEVDKGICLDFGFFSTPLVKHNIQWEGVIQDLNVLGRGSSFDIRKQAGISLKSAIRHIVSCDFRDDPIFPTGGTFFQFTSEGAGLGGDIGFVKNDLYMQSNISLIQDCVFQTTFTGGFLRNISDTMKVRLSDLFFLGGPLSIRGFEMRGVGPHSSGDALGATSYWAAGFHFFSPLPFRPGQGGLGDQFRTHFFINAGNIGHFLDQTKPILNIITDNFRVSYGIGIALRLGTMARVEVNYCYPVIYDGGDQLHPGVQFGIGLQFL